MSVPEGVLKQLFQDQGRKLTYAKGEIILNTDEAPLGTFLLDSGYVKVYSLTKQGSKFMHIVYGPGELFPLIWTINRTRPNLYFEALEPVSVTLLSNKVLTPYLQREPGAYEFISAIIEQFNVYTNRVENLEYKFARERIIYRLLFLAGRFGVTGDRGISLPASFTQQLIGDSINVSRETVSRELERLQQKGLIGFRGRQIILIDTDALSADLDQSSGVDFWHQI